MLTRREMLETTLQGSSLIALGATVPGFLANAARAAEPGKETILVVIELTGGNDGLNTVIPFGDDLYHKARPTLGVDPKQVVKLDGHVGLHPSMASFRRLFDSGQLAVVQGVGYPNPNRSHFESMDVWQSGDPRRKTGNGWLGRSMTALAVADGWIPGIHIGADELPLALQGAATAVPSIHRNKPYDLNLGGQRSRVGVPPGLPPKAPTTVTAPPKGKAEPNAEERHRAARRRLIQELAEQPRTPDNSLLQFVQRSSLQTYATIDRLREITRSNDNNIRFYNAEVGRRFGELGRDLDLVARMIQSGFRTRIYYVSLGGFDTHSNQQGQHQELLREVANGIFEFFTKLQSPNHAGRVVVMTFSEFGRRVKENSSKGTDHGAASCLFLAGPAVKGGVIGKHPSLADLDDGDLKFHTDFRQVYASLLDGWLGCPSEKVLGGKFAGLPLLKKA